MLENECSCTLFEMFSWRRYVPLSQSYSNGGMAVWIVGGRRSRAHLRCAWNESGLKLLNLITPNKNEWSSCKNLDAMIGATSP
jgi:hypothetical protein